MKNEQKAILGYTSLEDLVNTILGVKSIALNAWLSFFCAFTTFVTSYVWDSSESVNTLMALMIGDWVIGVSLAFKATFMIKFRRDSLTKEQSDIMEKRQFSSTRAPRTFVAIVLSLFLLAIAHNLAKANQLYIFLPAMVYGGITGTYFISLIENVAEFGLISKDFVALLKEKLNPINWFKK